MTDLDPAGLPLDELRALRSRLLADDDALSYVRRLAQARLDLIEAEVRRRSASDHPAQPDVPGAARDLPAELADDLPAILGGQLTRGPARPPRPAVEASEHPLAVALDELCNRGGVADVAALDDADLGALEQELRTFERDRSRERQELFARLDTLSAELVRRYRDQGADVDDLLSDG